MRFRFERMNDGRANTFSHLNSLCRTCFSYNENSTFDIFREMCSNGETYSTVLMECSAIMVSEDDDLPHHICVSCKSYLDSFVLFRKTCADTEKALVKLRDDIRKAYVPVKVEIDESSDENFDGGTAAPEFVQVKSETPKNDETKAAAPPNEDDDAASGAKLEAPIVDETGEIRIEYVVKQVREGFRWQTMWRTPKSYKCELCTKIFRYQRLLNRHMLSHTNERPYTCKVCGKSYRHDFNLKRHTIVHESHFREKMFKCELCPRRYNFKGNLERHFKSHVEEKKFKCDECVWAFHHKWDLENHRLTHTGKKSFECNLCGKLFVRKRNMNNHMERRHPQADPGQQIADASV